MPSMPGFGKSSSDQLRKIKELIVNELKQLEENDVELSVRAGKHPVEQSVSDLFNSIGVLVKDLRRARRDFKDLEARNGQLDARCQELEDYKNGLEPGYDNEVAKRIRNIQGQYNSTLNQKDAELDGLRQAAKNWEVDKRHQSEQHAREMQRLRGDYETKANTTQSRHAWEKSEAEKRWKSEMEREKGQHASEIFQQNERFKYDKRHLQEQLDSARTSTASAVSAERDRGRDILASKQRAFDTDRAQAEGRFQRDLANMQAQLSQSIDENRSLQLQFKADKKKMESEFEDSLTDQITHHDQLMGKVKSDFEKERAERKSEIQGMRAKFTAEKEELMKKNQTAIASQREAHLLEISKLKAEFEEQTKRWGMDRDALMQKISEKEAEFEKRKKQMENDFQKKRSELEEKSVQDQALLRKDVESLNGALLTREKFTPLTDQRLKSPFISLGKDIDLASRAKWKPDQSQWPNDLLSKLSSNQRRVRQQLAQDILWTILFEGIFCSPFRIFGREGKELEASWQEDFGTGDSEGKNSYAWPKPSLESERWRYRTTIRLQEAVTKPASKWDSSSEVKAEYNSWLQGVAKELVETLDKICQLDQATRKELEELPRKAAELWLDMIIQRCRIKVIIPESNLQPLPERVKEAQESGLELVEIPELRRFGDPKGNDLQKSEAINVGRTTKLSAR